MATMAQLSENLGLKFKGCRSSYFKRVFTANYKRLFNRSQNVGQKKNKIYRNPYRLAIKRNQKLTPILG